MQKTISIILAAAFFACLMAACAAPREEAHLQSPVVSFESLEDLQKEVGISFAMPSVLPDEFESQPEYHAISGKIAEIIWRRGDAVMTYRVAARSEELSGDISGDYNDYKGEADMVTEGQTFRIRYNTEGEVAVAVSSHDGLLYAFSFTPPVSLGQFQAMAEAMQYL